MNYNRIYYELINKAMNRELLENEIYEQHHILPKSLGGNNSKENIVKLTLREHFVAHLLLYKIYINDPVAAGKMISALNRMSKARRYRINSRQYDSIRKEFIKNHPCYDKEIKEKIKSSLHNTRIHEGFIEIYCGCGCGTFIQLSKENTVMYVPEHRPTLNECHCGCGEKVVNMRRKYIEGHKKKIKCGCGCGYDTFKTYDCNDPDLVIFKNSHNPESRKKISQSLKSSLAKLTKEEMDDRMQKSFGKASNSKDRFDRIKKGKSSLLVLDDGTNKTFFHNYDDVKNITGYTYSQLRYIISRYDGVLPNGSKVSYIKKYGDKNP